MVLVINQESFNEAVNENVAEFGMSHEEAVADTIKQFEAQGVDLSNIIKTSMVLTADDTNALSAAINELGKLVKSKEHGKSAEYEKQLSIIRTECDKGLEHKVFAGKEGAYHVVLDVLTNNIGDVDLSKSSLKCMILLMTKQPDLLDDAGVHAIINFLDKSKDPEIHRLVLKWVKECCIMHEHNRQKIFDAAILDHLKLLLEKADAVMLQDVLGVLRALVLDDDVRVEFGRAHEHARVIASDTLCSITSLLSKFKNDEHLMSDLLATLSALLVRTEFCKKVEDSGGLDVIKDIMCIFQEKEKLTKQCFKLLKGLAGNDEIKAHIIQRGLAPIITSSLDGHKGSLPTATAGLGCVAALTLRSTENSQAFFDAGISEVIVNVMKLHLDDMNVQKNASWAVRNMVSRSRHQNKTFLDLGIEEILKQDLKKFPKCEYDIKSALRDLGCNVKFKEEWTGKGGLIHTQSKH